MKSKKRENSSKKPYQICKRCVMDTSNKWITFDSKGLIPSSWFYNTRDSSYLNSILRKAKQPISIFSEIKFGLREDLYFRIYRRIKTFYPLNTFNYDKRNARQLLEKKLGWENPGAKHSDSIYTTFCQQIYKPKRYGIDYRRCHYSMDVCLKKIDRETAIEELKLPLWENLDVYFYVNFIAYKLGYSNKELTDLMNQPALWYKDYLNKEMVLGFIYNVYRLLRGKSWANNLGGVNY